MVVRLYVDFNTMTTDPKERVYINTQLQPALAQDLRPGLVVTLYDEEMEVENHPNDIDDDPDKDGGSGLMSFIYRAIDL